MARSSRQPERSHSRTCNPRHTQAARDRRSVTGHASPRSASRGLVCLAIAAVSLPARIRAAKVTVKAKILPVLKSSLRKKQDLSENRQHPWSGRLGGNA